MSILSSTRAGASSMAITSEVLYNSGWKFHKRNINSAWYLDKTHYIKQNRPGDYITKLYTPYGSWFLFEMRNMADLHLFMSYSRSQGRKKYYFYKKMYEKCFQYALDHQSPK